MTKIFATQYVFAINTITFMGNVKLSKTKIAEYERENGKFIKRVTL